MRIAVYADIHGNAMALDAVLADVATVGVDATWIIGDVADMGADPVGVADRLRTIEHCLIVRGNADREVIRIDPARELASIRSQPDAEALVTLTYVQEAAWTRGALTVANHLAWLEGSPLEIRETLPDGTRVLLVHARPGHDDGPGFLPEATDDEVRALLGSPDADLVIVGHTHTPVDRVVDGVRVINPGSVSNPPSTDQRAAWLLIEAETSGYRIERRHVAYDVDAYIRSLAAVDHPARTMIERYFGRDAGADQGL